VKDNQPGLRESSSWDRRTQAARQRASVTEAQSPRDARLEVFDAKPGSRARLGAADQDVLA